MDNFDLKKYLAESQLLKENADKEIVSYIADTYIQNAKDGDRRYAGFLDLNIRDAVQDVIGILQDPKHPLHNETKEEYGIVQKDKAKGIFENKFDVATTEKIAQAVADAFTAEDKLDLKYTVTPGTEESSFDLDVERGANTPDQDSSGQDIENYLGDTAGGSFYIKDGVVYNAAMRNAPVAKVSAEGEVEMISAADSRAAIDSQDDIPAIDRMYNSDAWVQAQRDAMEESKEEKKSNKMKKSELKEMIRTAFLSEAEGDEEEVDVEDTEEVDVDVEATDGDDIDVTDNADVEITGDKKEVQDNLQAALEAAKALGDQKLIDQIGNSITFFTRTHIVGKEEVAEEIDIDNPATDAEVGMKLEESINRMQKLAGLIK